MIRFPFVVLAGAALLLAACASEPKKDPTDAQYKDFGRSVREDIAAQIADPDPVWKNQPQPPSDGMRSVKAVTRYQSDSVRKANAASTQTAVGASTDTGGP
jgi:type IV pilus biogenesis protein CpaD/CtpE